MKSKLSANQRFPPVRVSFNWREYCNAKINIVPNIPCTFVLLEATAFLQIFFNFDFFIIYFLKSLVINGLLLYLNIFILMFQKQTKKLYSLIVPANTSNLFPYRIVIQMGYMKRALVFVTLRFYFVKSPCEE